MTTTYTRVSLTVETTDPATGWATHATLPAFFLRDARSLSRVLPLVGAIVLPYLTGTHVLVSALLTLPAPAGAPLSCTPATVFRLFRRHPVDHDLQILKSYPTEGN